MECYGCGSKDHFLKDCPKKQAALQQRDKSQKQPLPRKNTTGQFQSRTSPSSHVDGTRSKIRSGKEYVRNQTQKPKGKGKGRPGAKVMDCDDPDGDDNPDEEYDYPSEADDSQEQDQEPQDDGQDEDDDCHWGGSEQHS